MFDTESPSEAAGWTNVLQATTGPPSKCTSQRNTGLKGGHLRKDEGCYNFRIHRDKHPESVNTVTLKHCHCTYRPPGVNVQQLIYSSQYTHPSLLFFSHFLPSSHGSSPQILCLQTLKWHRYRKLHLDRITDQPLNSPKPFTAEVLLIFTVLIIKSHFYYTLLRIFNFIISHYEFSYEFQQGLNRFTAEHCN